MTKSNRTMWDKQDPLLVVPIMPPPEKEEQKEQRPPPLFVTFLTWIVLVVLSIGTVFQAGYITHLQKEMERQNTRIDYLLEHPVVVNARIASLQEDVKALKEGFTEFRLFVPE